MPFGQDSVRVSDADLKIELTVHLLSLYTGIGTAMYDLYPYMEVV
jgi:hypothetical protein